MLFNNINHRRIIYIEAYNLTYTPHSPIYSPNDDAFQLLANGMFLVMLFAAIVLRMINPLKEKLTFECDAKNETTNRQIRKVKFNGCG